MESTNKKTSAVAKIAASLLLPWALYAQSIPELFDALKTHAQTRSDEMQVKKSEVYKDMATSKLYPKINLFGKYDNYSTPTGMLPIPPNELLGMVKDPNVAQPFTYNNYRAGGEFTMPIFVKSIYTVADKASAMQESAEAKKRINLIKNQAIIVGANANYNYLVALEKSLEGKEKSLLETQKTVKIKVDNGRAPASALYKINDGLNQVAIAKNNIALQRESIISTIEGLTGIVIKEPIAMEQIGDVHSNALESLNPLRKKIEADRLSIRSEQEKLYPALFAHGSYTFMRAKAYNNHDYTNEHYGNIGLTLNIPIVAMDQYDEISLNELEVQSGEVELEKQSSELTAKAHMLQSSLPLIENSQELYTQSVQNKKELLKIAKLNYTSGRLSTEEYLRYEDDVVSEEAKLFKAKADRWQVLMQLAVIYANNIEEIVQ